MGVVLSSQRAQTAGLFVTKYLEESAPYLASNDGHIEDFVQFIKDGDWIDLLADTDYFIIQSRAVHRKFIPVTFYTNNALPAGSPVRAKVLRQNSNSVRTSSGSTRDSLQSCSADNFKECYADLQERTCFTPDQMAAFLISIVYPLYGQTGERKALFERGMSLDEIDDCSTVLQSADVTMNNDVAHLQDMLLAAAAFFDEHDLRNKLHSQEWIHTLHRAVGDCPLDVCICEVSTTGGISGDSVALHPVLVNDVARKRMHTLNRSFKQRRDSLQVDFLHLWSIEGEETLQEEVNRCLHTATPMQLTAVQAFSSARTVLDVSHIFDAAGRHRYVLGVQMEVPEDGQSEKHLQYLRDTALVIAHIVKCSNSSGNGVDWSVESGVKATSLK